MVKIGIHDVDRIRGLLNVPGTKRESDCCGSECERLSLLVPEVTYTIPEIMLVAMLDIDIRQWSIETGVAKVYPLLQVLSVAYGLANARLELLEAEQGQ